MKQNKTVKNYVAYKPCKKPPSPQFQWNGYGGKNPEYIEIPGIGYYEDEVGYYIISGGLICDAS